MILYLYRIQLYIKLYYFYIISIKPILKKNSLMVISTPVSSRNVPNENDLEAYLKQVSFFQNICYIIQLINL